MDVYLNDRFIPLQQATLPIGDLSIQRGYGIFDFFRLQENVLLYVEDHLHRFCHSAEVMHLPVPYPVETMRGLIRELADRNNLREAGIKMILTGGESADAWHPGTPAFMLMASPMSLGIPQEPKAVRVITHEYVRDVPEAKNINYTMGVWLQQRMKAEGTDDVVYFRDGKISELPRCNIFVVRADGSVITPDSGILEGITRKRLLEVHDVPVRTGVVTTEDLQAASEVFLTSSTKRIQAIVSIDGKPVGNGQPGPVTRMLLGKLLETERQYIAAAKR